MIFYISAVNDEVSHRKKPPPSHTGEVFHYNYGWAFFFAAGSFIPAMMAVVSNITLYIKRYQNLEDMTLIVPGLSEKQGGFDIVNQHDIIEMEYTVQVPTVVL